MKQNHWYERPSCKSSSAPEEQWRETVKVQVEPHCRAPLQPAEPRAPSPLQSTIPACRAQSTHQTTTTTWNDFLLLSIPKLLAKCCHAIRMEFIYFVANYTPMSHCLKWSAQVELWHPDHPRLQNKICLHPLPQRSHVYELHIVFLWSCPCGQLEMGDLWLLRKSHSRIEIILDGHEHKGFSNYQREN